ncbi:MAG TPA: polysaccharide deacetylase family protein [Candidatus Ozemobacteraceae bacterium]|nr:polysaccharide deacetylase family protein [Candidatus Ozemobacteraceae bacterium]
MSKTAVALSAQQLRRALVYHALLTIVLAAGAVFGFLHGLNQSRAEILVPITFHGVTDAPTRPWEITWSDLTGWLERLKRHEYTALEPASFSAWLSGSIRGGRRFLLTFDDGLETSAAAIRRIRSEFGIGSVLFITTDLIGQPGYLTWDGLRALASEAGCLVGLHGLRHIEPPKIVQTGGNLLTETLTAKEELERQLVASVTWYAYPFGEYDTVSRNCIASAGLEFGFTIDGEAVTRTTDRLLLPRVMYLKGVEQAGGPSIADWTPPRGASTGSLHITLAIFVGLMALRSAMRFIMLRRLQRAHAGASPTA